MPKMPGPLSTQLLLPCPRPLLILDLFWKCHYGVLYPRHMMWKGFLECDAQLEHSTLALFNKLKKGGCLKNAVILEHSSTQIALLDAAPEDEEREHSKWFISSHASRKEESMGRNGANIRFLELFLKSPCLRPLVWPLQPLFHPQFECILKTSEIGLLFHKTGYQFRRFAGFIMTKLDFN
jgi:hypothetical protein